MRRRGMGVGLEGVRWKKKARTTGRATKKSTTKKNRAWTFLTYDLQYMVSSIMKTDVD